MSVKPFIPPFSPPLDYRCRATAMAAVLYALHNLRLWLPPTPEQSGTALLAAVDFCEVDNAHLAASDVRFVGPAPVGADEIEARLLWMFHAGTSADDQVTHGFARLVQDTVFAQLTPYSAVFEDFVESVAAAQEVAPEVIAALFGRDLEAVCCLIDYASLTASERRLLIVISAWMFVFWAAFEVQREGCLGWRLIFQPMNGQIPACGKHSWTIGQVVNPLDARYKFAVEMHELSQSMAAAGIEKITDGRRIRRINRKLEEYGLLGFEAKNEKEVLAAFGSGRLGGLSYEIGQRRVVADVVGNHFSNIIAFGYAPKRMDRLSAPISAVERLAIVCARACEMASLASTVKTTEDLHAMLQSQGTAALIPSDETVENVPALRCRLLLHAARVAFLRDGQHLSEDQRGADEPIEPPIDLTQENSRRGRDTIMDCFKTLAARPEGWKFSSPFGWAYHIPSPIEHAKSDAA